MSDAKRLDQWDLGPLDLGVDNFNEDISAEPSLTSESFNVSSGIHRGLGPRYGFSTIPGHADNESMSGSREPGLRASEGSPSTGLKARLKFYGVVPLSIGPKATPSARIDAYAWVLTNVNTAVEYVTCCLGTTTSDVSAYIYDGLSRGNIDSVTSGNHDSFLFEAIAPRGSNKGDVLTAYLALGSQKYYACVTTLSVSGQQVPMRWYVGEAITTGDSTHAPDIACHRVTNVETAPNSVSNINTGVPNQFNLQNYSKKRRFLGIYTITVDGTFNTQYTVTVDPDSTYFLADVGGDNTRNLNIDGITATALVAGTPSNTKAALVDDPECVQDTSYRAVLSAAGGKAYCWLFQDAYACTISSQAIHRQQMVDLTSNAYEPLTIPPESSSYYYLEDTRKKACPFSYWPSFVRGTQMTTHPTGVSNFATLGGANTGVLRANTVYEFTYAVYNKRLGFETNVNPNPVKVQIGADDYNSILLFNSAGSPGGKTTIYEYQAQLQLAILPFLFHGITPTGLSYTGCKNFLNFYQYRFYYRREGTFEWIPALTIDAANFWFFPHLKVSACTGALSGLPGGQPGGFSDYSTLPKDTYNCVVSYKDRAWWFSEKAICFSLRNNIFAYAGRNSISAPAGKFLGGTVHNYPGQAQQSSRLIIWSSTGAYVARFTGVREVRSVQVSADTGGEFPVDGSDLVVDPWTSDTAFSYRAAVVAEGILFFWGPQGFRRDDGRDTPTRIGAELEPDLKTYYDPNKTDEIFGVFNEDAREIIWFYPPRTSDGYATHALVYNLVDRVFTPYKFVGKIDSAAALDIKSAIRTAGKRVVTAVRETAVAVTQRGYFFDVRNRAGDMRPNNDMVVKQISTVGGVRRMTLAAGYDAANLASIVAGDLITIHQAYDYYSSLSPTVPDMKVLVTAVGAGTIDFELPTGGLINDGSPTYDSYFPIWHEAANGGLGLNGFAYAMELNYWAPGGLGYGALWQYIYFLAKFNEWPAPEPTTFELDYKTPVSPGYLDTPDVIEMEENTDGHFQRMWRMQLGNENTQGNALRLKVSGVHNGQEWVLQFIKLFAAQLDANYLKTFEA